MVWLPKRVVSRHLLEPFGYVLLAQCAVLRAMVWALRKSTTSDRLGVAWGASYLARIQSELSECAREFVEYKFHGRCPERLPIPGDVVRCIEPLRHFGLHGGTDKWGKPFAWKGKER